MPSLNKEMTAGDRWLDFLKFCNNHAKASWWFRGISSNTYKLIPKAGRGLEKENWYGRVSTKSRATFADRERRIFEAFRRRARLELQFSPVKEFEWLALAQHHGVPTRLLDRTPNPLMAAWFATNETDPEDDQVALIYAARVTGKLLTMETEEVDPFIKTGSPRFIISPHWHPRVRAQRGCFSIHPVPNKAWTLDDVTHHEFEIPKKDWGLFRRRLFYFGIDASTVMADLAGLGEALNWQYTNSIGIGQVGY